MAEHFDIQVSDATLNDLADRLQRTRLLGRNSFDAWKEGTDPAYLQQLISYWLEKFDWRTQERDLNRFHHFTSTIDGTKLHFIHEKGTGENSEGHRATSCNESGKGIIIPFGYAS